MDRISSYLQRIGFMGKAKIDFSTLYALQRLHLESVPYENLDIMRGIPISLEIDDMYDKIVRRKRGGYCFELNGLFAWLLRSLGFKVTDYMARFLKDEPEIPMRRHRILSVTCKDGDFIVDVGAGVVMPKRPLPFLIGKIDKQENEQYTIEEDSFLGYVVYQRHHDSWHRLYSFTKEPQLEKDFIPVSFYCERHPDSIFKTKDMVHLFTKKGRKSVAGREIRLFEPEGTNILRPSSEAAYFHLLDLHFGLRL